MTASPFMYTLGELADAAAFVISNAGTQNAWCFYGQMGAGKTTLIKEIARQLGVEGEVSSPTFSLVNEYSSPVKSKLYHFDFYRIRSVEEVYDIGYEDYFTPGALCLVEWPEKAAEVLQHEQCYNIRIEIAGDKRIIYLNDHSAL